MFRAGGCKSGFWSVCSQRIRMSPTWNQNSFFTDMNWYIVDGVTASELPLTSEIFRCFEVKRQAGRYRQVASLETWMALGGAIDAVDDDSCVAAFSEEPCNWFSANSVHCLRSKYIHHHDPPCSFFTPGQEPIKRINSREQEEFIQCLWYVLVSSMLV